MYVPDDENYIVDGENYAPPKPPEPSKHKSNKKFPIKKLGVIGGALLVGLGVYLVSMLVFGEKTNKTNPAGVSLKLDLENTVVKDAYSMVTYGRTDTKMNKYVKEQAVALADFSNYEKFYYAFSLVQKDHLYDTKLTSNSKKIYGIKDQDVDKLMKAYFGEKVAYLKQGTIPITLPFTMDDGNYLELIYSASDKAFSSVIAKKDVTEVKALVPTYLTQLESATQQEDGTLQLVERIIYLTSSITGETIQYSVYRDFEHTMPIVRNKETTSSQLATKPIDMKDYIDKSNVITYTFKKSGDSYYFYQSEIKE